MATAKSVSDVFGGYVVPGHNLTHWDLFVAASLAGGKGPGQAVREADRVVAERNERRQRLDATPETIRPPAPGTTKIG